MKNVFLTGFMGTGKSSVGKILAERLGCQFIDLDALIVAEAGRSIKEIFAEQGEPYFRALEAEIVRRLASENEKGAVVSTGGGVVIDPENRRWMRENGVVVNLTATAQAIRKRLAADNERPLLQNDNSLEKIVSMLAEREPFYRDADIRIATTGKGVDDIVLQILVWLKKES